MIGIFRKTASHWMLAMGLALMALMTGCGGGKLQDLPGQDRNTFQVGDLVTITFTSISGQDVLPVHAERVHEDGTINLPFIGAVMALGKTTGELQKEVHDRYVPKFYPELGVIVASEARYYYVDGEVRLPGQKEYPGNMTVAKAISVAGGFTDFARKTKVLVTRGNKSVTINAERAINDPAYDIRIYPGDKIYVRRRPL